MGNSISIGGEHRSLAPWRSQPATAAPETMASAEHDGACTIGDLPRHVSAGVLRLLARRDRNHAALAHRDFRESARSLDIPLQVAPADIEQALAAFPNASRLHVFPVPTPAQLARIATIRPDLEALDLSGREVRGQGQDPDRGRWTGQVTAIGPEHLKALAGFDRLEQLELRFSTGLGGSTAADWPALPALKRLDLGGCRLPETILQQLSDAYPRLESLNCRLIAGVRGSGLSDRHFAGWNGHPTLREIVLRDCAGITDAGLRELLNTCPSLDSIDLTGSRVTGAPFIEHPADGRSALRHLLLRGSDAAVSDALMSALVRDHPGLETLELSFDRTGGTVHWNAWPAFPQLRGLHLDGMKEARSRNQPALLPVSALASVLRGSPELESLRVSCPRAGGDHDALANWPDLPKLRTLGLEYFDGMSDAGLHLALTRYPQLETLTVRGACGVTGAAFGRDGPPLQGLARLDLGWIDGFDPRSIAKIAHRCPNLRVLDLRHSAPVPKDGTHTRRSAFADWPRFEHLERLDLRGMQLPSARAFDSILRNCPKLEDIALAPLFTDAERAALRRRGPTREHTDESSRRLAEAARSKWSPQLKVFYLPGMQDKSDHGTFIQEWNGPWVPPFR